MSVAASRELRNDTAGLLRRVQAGEEITVTVNGKAVALLTGLRQTRCLNRLPSLRSGCATVVGTNAARRLGVMDAVSRGGYPGREGGGLK